MLRQTTFERDGFRYFKKALDPVVLARVEATLSGIPTDRPGVRLTGIAGLNQLLAVGSPIGALAKAALGEGARPVRAILLTKTRQTNWQVGWHQDRTIAVRARVVTEGYGPWSMKAGLHHVEPPFALLANLVTLRVHLDSADAAHAPLLVAPGSHRFGRIAEADIPAIAARCGTHVCLADPGDVWLYATPILHASNSATGTGRRRVLQVDYASTDLPPPLAWLGI